MDGYRVGESDTRDWGSYEVTAVDYDGEICTKCEKDIIVNPGFMLSVQSHDKRSERWKTTSGSLTAIRDGQMVTLKPGEEIDIGAGVVHTMVNIEDIPCVVHEIQRGECCESDIHRYWDINGREVEESTDSKVIASIECCMRLLPRLEQIRSRE